MIFFFLFFLTVHSFKDLLFSSQWYPKGRWERAVRLWFVACYLWGKRQFWSSSFMEIILLVRLFFPSLPAGSGNWSGSFVGRANLKMGSGAQKWGVIERDQKGHRNRQRWGGEVGARKKTSLCCWNSRVLALNSVRTRVITGKKNVVSMWFPVCLHDEEWSWNHRLTDFRIHWMVSHSHFKHDFPVLLYRF